MSLVANERLKLTAAYLNTGAGACLTAGVVAPFAALLFGYTGANGPSNLTFGVGVSTFLVVSIALHLVARQVLKGLRP